jgi:hypothetical protein
MGLEATVSEALMSHPREELLDFAYQELDAVRRHLSVVIAHRDQLLIGRQREDPPTLGAVPIMEERGAQYPRISAQMRASGVGVGGFAEPNATLTHLRYQHDLLVAEVHRLRELVRSCPDIAHLADPL